MSLRFCCPCGQKLKVADDAVGKRAHCPKCARWLRIPTSASYETVAEEVQAREPSHEPHPAVANQGAPPPSPEQDGSRIRVVVADADKADLGFTAAMLRDHGYLTLTATDGERVLEMVRTERPDACVMDVKLAGMSGFQVVQHVRDVANSLNKDVWETPMLMTTNKVRGRDRQYALSLGVDDYIEKPVTPALLCPKLEKAIAKYRQLGHGHKS